MSKSNIILQDKNIKCKPFLRWAGGKKWLVKEINNFLPKEKFNNYHEPFIGGGAIFFNLLPDNISYLNDLNIELIETYQLIKNNVEEVISELKKFKNNEDCYYLVRSKKYRNEAKRAARFIFLNQTSFNGIYRVNLKDLVFLDPPYTITHNNNGFFKYNKKLFSEDDQYRLSNMIDIIKEKKAYYILTNAAHHKVKEIFEKGDPMVELKRASLIGGINAKRGKYAELIITNCH